MERGREGRQGRDQGNGNKSPTQQERTNTDVDAAAMEGGPTTWRSEAKISRKLVRISSVKSPNQLRCGLGPS